jgi:hypothetical protein
MVLNSQRRLGLIVGLLLGLGFSITSNLINKVFLPEIPLFVPWPGTSGLIVMFTLMFGALGLLAAWTEETLPGVLLSALVGTLVASIWSIITDITSSGGAFVVLLFVFLPRMFFYLPYALLVRSLVDRLEHTPRQMQMAPARRWMPVLFWFFVAAGVGAFSLHAPEVRQSLTRMEALIEEGSHATSRTELPKSLQAVEGYTVNARGAHTLQLGDDPDVLPVQRPIVQYGEIEPFIIVRFENGFRFGCVFSPPYIVPACIDF